MAEPDDWDLHWRRYAEAAARNPAQQMRHRIITDFLVRSAGRGPARILDIGSGQGDLLARLPGLLPQAELLGFELSASGVEISRKKVPIAAFEVADLFHPPASLESRRGWATHAVCSEVLEHVDDPVLFLKAARLYLAEGARIIVTVPGGPMSAFDRHIGHRTHFTRQSAGKTLREAGFSVDRVKLSGFPFFNLYRAVVIARGQSLAKDVESGTEGASSRLANLLMATFRILFRASLPDFPWGWQVVVDARNSESSSFRSSN